MPIYKNARHHVLCSNDKVVQVMAIGESALLLVVSVYVTVIINTKPVIVH